MTAPSRAPAERQGPSEAARGLHLLVALPALDEERTVADVVSGLPRALPGVTRVEVLVVDDGSEDATAERAEAAGARVIRKHRRGGVGAAFHTALREAIDSGADLLVTIDADGQFDPADVRELVAPVVAGEADFATGSRFSDAALVPDMPAAKLWGNRAMARLVSRLCGRTIRDASCGLRCYNRRAALSLNPIGRFTYTQEVLLNLAFKGLRLVEVPVRVRGQREFGESRVAGNLWTYAIYSAGILFRCYRDYRPLRFFGGIALVVGGPGLALLGFLGLHYLVAGSFSPYKWTGFAGAAMLVLALLMLHLGILGDMLNRHRAYLEELLYRDRDRDRRPTEAGEAPARRVPPGA